MPRGDLGSHTLALQASLPAVETGDPTETEDCLGHNTAPVQETLVGSQPVAQEDGKESRIAVQERQLMDSMDLKHLV